MIFIADQGETFHTHGQARNKPDKHEKQNNPGDSYKYQITQRCLK